MNSSHARVIAHVLMKSHTRSILRHFWVTENGERIIRTVAVMVEQYDLGRDSIFSELRSEIVGNELSLFLRCPCHARCIARIERFVLYCKGWNRYTLLCHFLNISDKVAGIDIITLLSQFAALHFVVSLHPCGRWPWRCQYLNVRIDCQYLLHNRNNIVQVLSQREVL